MLARRVAIPRKLKNPTTSVTVVRMIDDDCAGGDAVATPGVDGVHQMVAGDLVITEYGIADLRGRCDKDVITELLKVTDSRFQDELLDGAKRAGKVPGDYQIPEAYRNNTPERLSAALKPFKAAGRFPAFPFGTDFTADSEDEGGLSVSACRRATAFPDPSVAGSRALFPPHAGPVPVLRVSPAEMFSGSDHHAQKAERGEPRGGPLATREVPGRRGADGREDALIMARSLLTD